MDVSPAEATARQMGRARPAHQHMRVGTNTEDKSEKGGPEGAKMGK